MILLQLYYVLMPLHCRFSLANPYRLESRNVVEIELLVLLLAIIDNDDNNIDPVQSYVIFCLIDAYLLAMESCLWFTHQP